jgi:hypothetical protein
MQGFGMLICKLIPEIPGPAFLPFMLDLIIHSPLHEPVKAIRHELKVGQPKVLHTD